ncbi:MAG: hypothetical protein KIT83_09305 [Bryobacterales bacterium]|nr:hypothetical protein [Bryobacterales bacterium]
MAYTKILSFTLLCLWLAAAPGMAQQDRQASAAPAQAATQTSETVEASKKADSYYNFAMGHLYSELSNAYGNRREFVDQAIEYYREALKADPDATF